MTTMKVKFFDMSVGTIAQRVFEKDGERHIVKIKKISNKYDFTKRPDEQEEPNIINLSNNHKGVVHPISEWEIIRTI
jgi:hypothetical protein